jgi:hypothetical protein
MDPHLEFLPEEPGDALRTESVFTIERVPSTPLRRAVQQQPEDPLLAAQQVPSVAAALLTLCHAIWGAVQTSCQRLATTLPLSSLDISLARFPVANATVAAFSGGAAIGASVMWLVGVVPATGRLIDASGAPLAASGMQLTASEAQLTRVAAPAPPSENEAAAIVYLATPAATPIVHQERARSPVPAPAVVQSTALTVTSAPAGAQDTLDGIGWGQTPVTIQYLSAGPKVLRVTKAGYESQQQTISLPGDQRSAAVRLTLRARTSPPRTN